MKSLRGRFAAPRSLLRKCSACGLDLRGDDEVCADDMAFIMAYARWEEGGRGRGLDLGAARKFVTQLRSAPPEVMEECSGCHLVGSLVWDAQEKTWIYCYRCDKVALTASSVERQEKWLPVGFETDKPLSDAYAQMSKWVPGPKDEKGWVMTHGDTSKLGGITPRVLVADDPWALPPSFVKLAGHAAAIPGDFFDGEYTGGHERFDARPLAEHVQAEVDSVLGTVALAKSEQEAFNIVLRALRGLSLRRESVCEREHLATVTLTFTKRATSLVPEILIGLSFKPTPGMLSPLPAFVFSVKAGARL